MKFQAKITTTSEEFAKRVVSSTPEVAEFQKRLLYQKKFLKRYMMKGGRSKWYGGRWHAVMARLHYKEGLEKQAAKKPVSGLGLMQWPKSM